MQSDKSKQQSSACQKGRPREFCTEGALDKALHVFWRQGYEGTTLTDLTEAMGISRPSLYAAFGNKEELFRLALDRYAETGPGSIQREALEEPTAREVAARIFLLTAESLTDPRNPPGCLSVQGALSCGDAAASIKQELCNRRSTIEAELAKRFARAKVDGDLGKGADPKSLARFVETIVQGMSVQAAGGASRDELKNVANMALLAWPNK